MKGTQGTDHAQNRTEQEGHYTNVHYELCTVPIDRISSVKNVWTDSIYFTFGCSINAAPQQQMALNFENNQLFSVGLVAYK